MTSLKLPTPEALALTVPHFSPEALGHLVAQITPHLPAPPRRGPKGMAITSRVRLALAHLREGVSLRGMARTLGIPATTLRDNLNPVLAAFDQLEPVLPDGTVIADFDDIAWWCAQTGGTVIVDGTEFAVARPGDQAAQRPFYSGKRKAHTTKTIAVCDASSNLLWATPLVAGATHDLTALRDANLSAHLADSGLDVLADSGFQGLQHDVTAVELPTRRRNKHQALTAVERFFNSVLASNRVRVEHAIGRLKQWRCLTVPKQRRDLLERWLPVCWALTSFQQAWPRP
jgi:hypothetical protein